ncbi:hypothetical protein POX_e06987 [Penicillium oxalicum]|uniref:hypothetical protein n=1 Tax=Penicillium oxalicum TaxID=69781 RepID=UPI0020B8F067|nr:hypothetical protein POX_e06987 [Penicillium oxalicum]KAI2788962.1 hypothetical protein POX_e06987 [Penicillium oxalicum]
MAFDTAGNLRAHTSRVHTEKRFSCTECLERLQEQHTDLNPENVTEQSITFPSYALLQAHIRTVHPPKCPKCPITCSTSRELRRHLEVAHATSRWKSERFSNAPLMGEKRFACGETDLSTSKKVAGWDGQGCGKRYGTKLALEEHIRTSHLGFKNSKAERRERLGLTDKPGNTRQVSTLAALTGQGYAEETGRRIPCFYETCEHRFHRDYDLWVHMSARHGCSEDQVQAFFMQRALLSDNAGPGGNSLGIYGLEFDQGFSGTAHTSLPTESHHPLDAEMLVHSEFTYKADDHMEALTANHSGMDVEDQVPTFSYGGQ